MSKPIDLKTVKIYEHLKNKPSLDNKTFKTLIQKLFMMFYLKILMIQ